MKLNPEITGSSGPATGETALRHTWRRVVRTVRAVAYWYLWFFLVVCVVAGAGERWDYSQDPTTYHQVYRDAVLYGPITWAHLVLAAIAIPFQAAGWKERRFSAVAVAVFALHVCYAVANRVFGIDLICCA
ncbi:MAG: hypothetical protein Q8K93_31385 [Reyranella sp.]|uniref:hypothetical protein n=1 Tax=Reyranella sp. TaxID=1929291 RepID=UPI0027311F76|nr:hypothetical protein [Reyranella sp.]MDP1966693.1 hypothetical protein [Reyranella sp.]MDP2372730.1 hypothetical protein [Reyranella sp.]